MSAFQSTSEPTKVTVMITSSVAAQSLSSTIVDNLQARQLEWSEPVWSESAWTQPAWSDSAIVPVPTEPISTPSTFLAHSQVSTPTPTPASDWVDTHRPNPSESKTGLITRNSQAPALDTPPGSVGTSCTASSGGMRSMPRQSEDVTDMPRVASPLNGLTHGPRRSRSLYQNNIPPQETHWP